MRSGKSTLSSWPSSPASAPNGRMMRITTPLVSAQKSGTSSRTAGSTTRSGALAARRWWRSYKHCARNTRNCMKGRLTRPNPCAPFASRRYPYLRIDHCLLRQSCICGARTLSGRPASSIGQNVNRQPTGRLHTFQNHLRLVLGLDVGTPCNRLLVHNCGHLPLRRRLCTLSIAMAINKF
jgi:hypothetical protein